MVEKMKMMSSIKELIFGRVQEILDEKAESAQKAVEIARESRDSDTKSSVGDKYETGRAMAQIEMEKSMVQLSKIGNLKKELSRIDLEKGFEKVEFGSLVVTDKGSYFISIGLGKVGVEGNDYFVISLASPIGKLLHGKCVGECVKFQGREFVIKDIL